MFPRTFFAEIAKLGYQTDVHKKVSAILAASLKNLRSKKRRALT